MVLPIVAYGDPVLKREAAEIDKDYPGLDELLENMWETMYASNGIGLAAPQIGESIRIFIVDASPFSEPDDDGEIDEMGKGLEDFKKVFINPIIEEETGKTWAFNEGCLSIPGVREDVNRKETIHITYFDENFEFQEASFSGYPARIIQHEYDHVEGILFTDHIGPLRRRLIKRKLNDISKGIVDVKYKMRFPNLKR